MKRERLGVMPLNGFWEFRRDPGGVGSEEGFYEGFESEYLLAVPASWNEQVPELMNYMGIAWYARRFAVPKAFEGLRAWLVFEGVNYRAEVWLNGRYLGGHEGGFTSFRLEAPVEYDSENLLVVKVDNTLTPKSVPPGRGLHGFEGPYFDFFHYGGIHRPVRVEFTGPSWVEELAVTAHADGRLRAVVRTGGEEPDRVYVKVLDEGKVLYSGEAAREERGVYAIEGLVRGIKPWDIGRGRVYKLVVDVYTESLADSVYEYIGFRDFEVRSGKLLLNGREVRLLGFGRHQDFPVFGRYLPEPVVVRDYAMMAKLNANSFRTSHYPYSSADLDYADRMGVLVILEAPLVGLREEHFRDREYLEKCKRVLSEMIREHRNRPSVIMYSVANEPQSWLDEAVPFLKELANTVRSLDPTRPVTFTSHAHMAGRDDKALGVADVISLNFYHGWYTLHGDLEAAIRRVNEDLEEVHRRYPNKPILITEFGAGAVAGLHSDPPEMWTEEYQAELISRYIDLFSSKGYVKGIHIWNLVDFKTPQSHWRVVLNRKGVLTRTRQPKLAARVVAEKFGRLKMGGGTAEEA